MTSLQRRSPQGCDATVAATTHIGKRSYGALRRNSIHRSNRYPSENDEPGHRTTSEIPEWLRSNSRSRIRNRQVAERITSRTCGALYRKFDPPVEPLSFGERWTRRSKVSEEIPACYRRKSRNRKRNRQVEERTCLDHVGLSAENRSTERTVILRRTMDQKRVHLRRSLHDRDDGACAKHRPAQHTMIPAVT